MSTLSVSVQDQVFNYPITIDVCQDPVLAPADYIYYQCISPFVVATIIIVLVIHSNYMSQSKNLAYCLCLYKKIFIRVLPYQIYCCNHVFSQIYYFRTLKFNVFRCGFILSLEISVSTENGHYDRSRIRRFESRLHESFII